MGRVEGVAVGLGRGGAVTRTQSVVERGSGTNRTHVPRSWAALATCTQASSRLAGFQNTGRDK